MYTENRPKGVTTLLRILLRDFWRGIQGAEGSLSEFLMRFAMDSIVDGDCSNVLLGDDVDILLCKR